MPSSSAKETKDAIVLCTAFTRMQSSWSRFAAVRYWMISDQWGSVLELKHCFRIFKKIWWSFWSSNSLQNLLLWILRCLKQSTKTLFHLRTVLGMSVHLRDDAETELLQKWSHGPRVYMFGDQAACKIIAIPYLAVIPLLDVLKAIDTPL